MTVDVNDPLALPHVEFADVNDNVGGNDGATVAVATAVQPAASVTVTT